MKALGNQRPLIGKCFSIEENKVRQILYNQQEQRIYETNTVHSMLITGFEKANLPKDHCPNGLQVSKELFKISGRKLTNAKNPYLSDSDRYEPLHHKIFPTTNYIRGIDEIDFTPLPDIAHDYFGHMPLMFNPIIAQLQRELSDMYMQANKTQKKDLYRLARYIIEYSVVKENGKSKIFGAGLLSSPGDFKRFINQEFNLIKADLEIIIRTDRSPDKPHINLFEYESFDHIVNIVQEYKKRLE